MDGDLQLFSFEEIPARFQGPKARRRPPPSPFEEIRAMHTWTLDKLQVLRLYLKMFRRVAGSGTYVDAFAGEGRFTLDGEECDGSALVAARSGAFRQLFFMEKSSARNARLHRHLDDAGLSPLVRARCKVLDPGDANLQIPHLLEEGVIDRARPVFALLDPDSTQLNWETVEALARYKDLNDDTGQCKVELWILFNTHQAMQRLWPADRRQPNPYARVLDRVIGDRAAWEDLYLGKGTAKTLMMRYAERLRSEFGYRYISQQAITDYGRGRDQYHMIHASDHPAAYDFMVWARRATDREQQRALRVELPF